MTAPTLASGGGSGLSGVMFTTNTAASSLIGLTYLDDHVRDGFTASTTTGFMQE